MTVDHVNAVYETLGCLVIVLSIRRAYIDKHVAGVSVITIGFFVSWCYWNLYFYSSLEQWYSFYASILLTAAQTIWVLQLVWYLKYPGGRRK